MSDAEHPDVIVRGVLSDGLPVLIRPLRPDDRAKVALGYQLLSENSRYQRFMTGKGRLSEAGLDALVDRVDQHGHVALAMVWPHRQRADILVGVGRFIRLKEDPATADVAVTIADQIQGKGAGRLMMRALAQRAREEGVRTFTATMTSTNVASFRMMAGAGTVTRDRCDDGVREVDVALGDP